MHITSFGAADGVTGSCHLLQVGDDHVLLDCGMFQGGRQVREMNSTEFDFDPGIVHSLIVGHAHLDHIGRIPLLYKAGFRGRIISTRPTFELARLSLLDSANLLSSEAERINRHRKFGEERVAPLYDEDDVFEALELWNMFVRYEQPFDLTDGIRTTFYDAGHILGSACVELQLSDEEGSLSFIYGGDLGNLNKPIIRDPQTPPTVDVAMVESTYGNRDHRDFSGTISELEFVINETFERGGNVVIPTFALERAQELLYVLYEFWRDSKIPEDVKIFLDSPMAISATRIFERHPDFYDSEATALIESGQNPFQFPALEYTREVRESMAINAISGGAIILAGSGMVTGGRVMHHLVRNLPRPECSVVFCGYQARGTTGRRIVERAPFVKLFGEVIPCESRIYTINGFSAHAGQRELTDWVDTTGASRVMLVHGEPEVKEDFKSHLLAREPERDVSISAYGERVALRGS